MCKGSAVQIHSGPGTFYCTMHSRHFALAKPTSSSLRTAKWSSLSTIGPKQGHLGCRDITKSMRLKRKKRRKPTQYGVGSMWFWHHHSDDLEPNAKNLSYEKNIIPGFEPSWHNYILNPQFNHWATGAVQEKVKLSKTWFYSSPLVDKYEVSKSQPIVNHTGIFSETQWREKC